MKVLLIKMLKHFWRNDSIFTNAIDVVLLVR